MKILFVVNDARYFLSHRLPVAKALKMRGDEVIVACPFESNASPKISQQFEYHPLPCMRGKINPLNELRILISLFNLYKRVKPSIVHHFTMKPIIYGSFISGFLKIKTINAPTGLGYLFTDSAQVDKKNLSEVKRFLLKKFVKLLFYFSHIFKHTERAYIFQNQDDIALFESEKILRKGTSVYLIKGSGVDLNAFRDKSTPDVTDLVLFPGRLLHDKGVVEFVEAAKLMKGKPRFVLVGERDEGNPSSISAELLQNWIDEGWVEHWGFQENMNEILSKARIVCLPSYREGVPKALLEAAACGKPIVTTDVPGCREVVDHDKNGFLVPAKDAPALAQAITRLLEDKALCVRFGKAGREKVKDFSVEAVIEKTFAVYNMFRTELIN